MSKIVSEAYPITEFNGIKVNTSIPSGSSNYYSLSSRSVKYIVMHYTGNSKDTAKANASYFNSGSRGASAHYFVDENSCYQSVALHNAAWAVGGTKVYKHADCRNLNSISIEMCCSGNYTVSEVTINNAAYLCAALCRYIGIGADEIDTYVLRHYDVWDKSCPAQWAKANSEGWTSFKERVKTLLEEDEPMTAEEKAKMEAIDKSLSNLYDIVNKQEERIRKQEHPMIYNYIDKNMPKCYHKGVQFCIDNGIIQGTGKGLGLNDNKLWFCTAIMRAVKFVAKLINVQL